jgi:hypothetical protein
MFETSFDGNLLLCSDQDPRRLEAGLKTSLRRA